MAPVRLEPAAPRYRVKHSTTEPLRSRFPSFQRGSTFSKGVELFGEGGGGGVKMVISIETFKTYDFPGGGPDPIPPLDPRLHSFL